MSGYNHECEYCGKMSDDYPKFDCCEDNLKSFENSKLFGRAFNIAQNDISLELDYLFYRSSPEEIQQYSEKIILFIKDLRDSHGKK